MCWREKVQRRTSWVAFVTLGDRIVLVATLLAGQIAIARPVSDYCGQPEIM